MSVLGELLLDRGLIDDRQLAAARVRQRDLGGRLGTCLLELGAIDEERLLAALAEQLGLPPAGVADLHGVPEEIHSLLPANLAISCEAVPFRVDAESVHLALLEIKNRGLNDELAAVMGKPVFLHVANEVRILEALERYYGKTCTPRYKRLLERLDGLRNAPRADGPPAGVAAIETRRQAGGPTTGRRRALVHPPGRFERQTIQLTQEELEGLRSTPPAAAGAAAPEEPPAAPPSRPASGPERAEPAEAPARDATPAATARTPAPAADRATPAEEEPPTAAAAPKPFAEAVAAASSAAAIGRLLLAELEPDFRRAVLFRVSRDRARGWLGTGVEPDRLRAFDTRLGRGSVFGALASGGSLYVGALTPSAARRELLDLWDGDAATECLLAALAVAGRTVAILYADRGREGLAAVDPGRVQALAATAAEGLRRLIVERKRTAGSPGGGAPAAR